MPLTDIRTTDAEGYQLVGEQSGSGAEVLIALHGGPGGGTQYLLPIHRLARDDRRVVTFDQLGTARSDVPSEDYAWSQQRAAADIDAVRAHTGAERVDVYGHSWGGTLALQYALDFPHRVRRLVLSNTAASVARMTRGFLRQLAECLPPAEMAAAVTADAIGDHADAAFRHAADRWLARYLGNGSGAEVPELTKEFLTPDAGALGLWGTRMWFADAAARGWDVEDRLSSITAPALVIHGGHDTAEVEVVRSLGEGLPSATWMVMPNSGHDMLTGPDETPYLSVIDSFLRGWG